ncbi:MAG: amidophosphoribosyltransferase [Elusimicrobia bacterium]|nr:amidophosphoribosyltransferase [Elusimicrobiota bacterium]
MCGVMAVADHAGASRLVHLGLYALQHRGQESAGIAAGDGACLRARTGMGLAGDVFDEKTLKDLPGRDAIGHVRYSTSGASLLKNAQPLSFNTIHGPVAISHNGNLTNAVTLRQRLENQGALFQSTTDSEVIVHLLARERGPIEQALERSLRKVEGAYSLLLLTPEATLAARDPLGFRPLVMGRLGAAVVFASETTALNLLGAKVVREVEPGEIVIVRQGRVKSLKTLPRPARQALCVFEHVYFARPDSNVFNLSVQMSRTALGRELARESRGTMPRADIVVAVPDSGVPAALGFSQESGIPLQTGFVRSHYIGRTFIQPIQKLRDHSVRIKLSPIREVLQGKRIVLVDDSIVRGTTSRKICRMLRDQGVREIHMAISSPPIVSPCYYGIDTPKKKNLIAATRSQEEIRRFLGVDSLRYLSLEGLWRATAGPRSSGFCAACFTGRYPTPLTDLKASREAHSPCA